MRAKHQVTPDQTQDVAEELRRSVAKRMRELLSYNEATSKDDSTADEEEYQIH